MARRWVELRHKHFGFASQRVATLLDEFRAKNRAASYKGGADGSALDMRAMRGLVASLPQYRRAPPLPAPSKPWFRRAGMRSRRPQARTQSSLA